MEQLQQQQVPAGECTGLRDTLFGEADRHLAKAHQHLISRAEWVTDIPYLRAPYGYRVEVAAAAVQSFAAR